MSAARFSVTEKESSPAVRIEDELFSGADIDGKRSGIEAVEAHTRAIGGDCKSLGAAAAVDGDGVRHAVAAGARRRRDRRTWLNPG
jgi:hypothetical protein